MHERTFNASQCVNVVCVYRVLVASFQISLDKIFSTSNISTLSETLIEDLKREDFVGTLPQCVEYVQQLVPTISR